MSVSCFLIEMKFISKLLWCLVMENVAFFNPHLRKIVFKVCIKNHKGFLKQIGKNEIEKTWYLGHTDLEHFRNFVSPRLTHN